MYLIDTNVLSELPKKKPEPAVLRWFGSLSSISMSSITLEELTFGVERARGTQKDFLRDWLNRLLATKPRIVDITTRVAIAAGRLRALRQTKGKPVTQADMLIAACALDVGLVLATRNTRDFEGCGVPLFNPFD